MQAHSPRAFPVGVAPPVGTCQGTGTHRRPARGRRPRWRTCLRKGCGRKYQPRSWNQRYCRDPVCLRLVRQWQAARRQATRRQDPAVKAQHAQAQHARRLRAKAASQAGLKPELTLARGHAAEPFFPLPYVIGRAATNRRRTPFATRHVSVAPTAVRLFAMSRIGNANGSGAAPWMAARSGPTSTEPRAGLRPTIEKTPSSHRHARRHSEIPPPPGAGRQLSRGLRATG